MTLAPHAAAAVAMALALGFVAVALRLVSPSGGVAGVSVGTAVSLGYGVEGFALLTLFFVVGSAATRIGWRSKSAEGTAEPDRGARGGANVLANGGVAALLALAATFGRPTWLAAAFAGALATALADTLGTEIGQASGRTTFLPTSFRRVPRGTPGAVSVEGTVAGAIGAAGLGATGVALGFLPSVALAAWVAAAAVVASLAESVAHAAGVHRRVGGHGLNALATAAGAALAVALAGTAS